MKRQTTLAELVNELKDQNLQKKDFVVPAHLLSMENGKLVVNNYNSNDSLAKLLTESGVAMVESDKLILNCLPVLHQTPTRNMTWLQSSPFTTTHSNFSCI